MFISLRGQRVKLHSLASFRVFLFMKLFEFWFGGDVYCTALQISGCE